MLNKFCKIELELTGSEIGLTGCEGANEKERSLESRKPHEVINNYNNTTNQREESFISRNINRHKSPTSNPISRSTQLKQVLACDNKWPASRFKRGGEFGAISKSINLISITSLVSLALLLASNCNEVAGSWSLFGGNQNDGQTIASSNGLESGSRLGQSLAPQENLPKFASEEPFLLLLSQRQIALVELPLIDNGRLSTVFNILDHQCSINSDNNIEDVDELDHDDDDDEDSDSSAGDQRKGRGQRVNALASQQRAANQTAEKGGPVSGDISSEELVGGEAAVGAEATSSKTKEKKGEQNEERDDEHEASNEQAANSNDIVPERKPELQQRDDDHADYYGNSTSTKKEPQAPTTSADGKQMGRKKRWTSSSLGKSGRPNANQHEPELEQRHPSLDGEISSRIEQKHALSRQQHHRPATRRKRDPASKQIANGADPNLGGASQSGSSSVSNLPIEGSESASDKAIANNEHGKQRQQLLPEPPLNGANDCELTDFDVHMERGLLFASNGRGQIHRIQLVARHSADDIRPFGASSSSGPSNISSLSSWASNGNKQNDDDDSHGKQQTTAEANEVQSGPANGSSSGDTLERSRSDATSSQHPTSLPGPNPVSGQNSHVVQADTMTKLKSGSSDIIWTRRLSKTAPPVGTSAKHGLGLKATKSWRDQEGSQQQMVAEHPKTIAINNKTSSRLNSVASIQMLLAVDWINDVLYVLDNNRLFCIDFDGRREILLIDDFVEAQRPVQLRVDPLNNFLFWLLPGRFHSSIYRLDLGVLLSNTKLTLERMRSNSNRSSASAFGVTGSNTNLNGDDDAISDDAGRKQYSSLSGAGGKTTRVFDGDQQEALISRHYAHPIITNLPKQTKLFFIDHKHSRIYVPVVQQRQQEVQLDSALGAGQTSNQNAEAANNTQTGAPCDSQQQQVDNQLETLTTKASAQILTYNLDSSDAGPLRSGSERDHWSSFQPGSDMQDLSLDSNSNLLYWLTNSGQNIFEEYLADDGKLHSAQHSLDGAQTYKKLIFFPSLVNQTNQPRAKQAQSGGSSSKSSIGTLMKILADYENQKLDGHDSTSHGNSKFKKSIYGPYRSINDNSISGAASADYLLQHNPFDHRDELHQQHLNQGLFSPSAPWFIFPVVGLLIFILYTLLFKRQEVGLMNSVGCDQSNNANPTTGGNQNIMNGNAFEGASSSIGSTFSGSCTRNTPGVAAGSLLGTGTISRWIQTRSASSQVGPSASIDATSNVSSAGLNRLSPSYILDLNPPLKSRAPAANQRHHQQMIISNAIDEHYGQEQMSPTINDHLIDQFMPNLKEWPSSISDYANKLYVPVEVMQDEELASIRRISSDKLEIDRHSAPLGKGHFGTVLQGVIRNCSASERAEWLAPATINPRPNQFSLEQTNYDQQRTVMLTMPEYENQSRLDCLMDQAAEQDQGAGPSATGSDNNEDQKIGSQALGAAPLESASSSGHGSTSNSDVFLSAQQASSSISAVSGFGWSGGGANTGDYLTPKSQCGQSSISDYDDRNSSSVTTSAVANPTYMFSSLASHVDGQMSLYDATGGHHSVSSNKTMLMMKPFKVAIKKLKDNPTAKEKQDFLQEAKLLAKFEHRNIVKLIGICLDRGSTLIVMELMLGGDLIRYMRKNCENEVMSLEEDDLLSICLDIVDGCCYLAEMNYIHRDLAARNCLVSSCRREERVVKLADFGLARDIYEGNYYKQLNSDSPMPLKWMAPECLCGKPTFTSQSDVWSFGVVMWEVTNYCLETPYSAVAPQDLKKHFDNGKRLDQSKHCNDDLYKLMLQCWQMEPDRRPTFRECQIELIEIRNKQQTKQQQQPYLQQQYEYHYHHQQCEI